MIVLTKNESLSNCVELVFFVHNSNVMSDERSVLMNPCYFPRRIGVTGTESVAAHKGRLRQGRSCHQNDTQETCQCGYQGLSNYRGFSENTLVKMTAMYPSCSCIIIQHHVTINISTY